MKISTKVSDKERSFLNTLLVSGRGEVPNKEGKVSERAEYKFIIKDGFIVGAMFIVKSR